MKYRILISAPYMHREKALVAKMLERYPFEIVWAEVRERLEEVDLLKTLPEFDGIICGDDRITPKVIDACPKLKVIAKWGTGIDSIDAAYAKTKGIPVCRTPGAFTEPVADTTLAYILHFARGVKKNDDVLRNGGWDKPPGFALFESKVGIIGFGTIGQAVAKRLQAFGCEVLVNDIVPPASETLTRLSARSVEKEQIYQDCQFITLHCDLNPTSHHLLNAAAFGKMKQKPFIINTARGPAIHEEALISALKSGSISGAALDVFEHEPLPLESPLRKMGNTLLASHNSNSSPACWRRVHENSIQMLAEKLGVSA